LYYLKGQAKHPELVLATTGTTSSGKSTLANFLIGEAILPTGVQEMSAGLVKVKHSDKRSLTIPKTKGSTWKTGRWENPTASEVRQRLAETMMAFREEENRNKEIEPVVFEVEWPIRLAERKEALGLPEGTQVTILDLPGLKAVNDERNGPIIQANIDKAFCLIAYNAEETDKEKQKTLLNQVVNQVMALSYGEKGEDEEREFRHNKSSVSSLSRMLFLLNRVDAFWRHDDAVEQLKKFKADVTAQIQEKLKRALPDHKEDVEKIALRQICSLPALWAVEADRLWEEPEKQAALLGELEGSFKKIFPENYFKQFPRDLKDLEKNQRKDLIKKALDCSFANDFETYLSQYIHTNLPQIIIGGYVNVMNLAYNRLLGKVCYLLETNKNRTMSNFCEYMLRKIVDLD
ncbi:MAG: dynamin family protein, partial [Acetobacter sp.]|nr:dynamin family protein [Acetobacter sp.]